MYIHPLDLRDKHSYSNKLIIFSKSNDGAPDFGSYIAMTMYHLPPTCYARNEAMRACPSIATFG